MKKMMTSLCLALCAFGTLVGFGQAGVTASRDYVNRKTELHEVMHPGDTNVVGYFLGTQTNKVLASKEYVDDSISASSPGDYNTVSNAAVKSRAKTDMVVYDTNGVSTVDRLATTGDVEVAVSRLRTDQITDGTNTIDAARNVYGVIYRDTWIGSDGNVFTNVSGTTMWVSIHESTRDPGLMKGYIQWFDNGGGISKWRIDNESSDSAPDYEIEGPADATSLPVLGLVRRDYIGIIGKLALTNEMPSVDYTTGNTQLVSTIESVAPVPGNYTVVSNAAMNARSMTEMGVRGAPQGEGSWFSVDGARVEWDADSETWKYSVFNISLQQENQYLMEYTYGSFYFSLNSDFYCHVVFTNVMGMVNHFNIIGYTNTLAQVSQIPVLPSGIVTTNGQGIVKFSGDRLSIENEAFKGSKLVVGQVLADVVTNKIVVSSTYNGGSIELQSNGSFDGKGMIRISGAGVDILGNTIDPEISVSGTNIIPIVFGAAHKSDIDYTTSNQQLVDTIEATAPAPGDYANVSNAAMRARSMTDLSYNGIVTNDFWDVTGGVSVRLYRKQISGGADYWESQDGVWGLAYAGGDWLFGQSQNSVYIYEPADAGSLSCTIGGTAYFLTRVSGKSGMIALTNDIPNVVTSILSETLDSYATKEYADSAPSSIVTKAYIQEKLEVYLYIGQDGGVYVRMPGN